MREWNLVARRETAGCCDKTHKCQADSSWPRLRPHRSRSESDAPAHGRTCRSVRPDQPAAAACPWILCRNSFTSSAWHCAHFAERNLGRCSHLVVIAVARFARCVAERAVHAVGHMGSLVGVASRAFYLCHFGGVRIVLDARVAVDAAQNAVDAGRVLRGINRDAFAAVRGHSRLAVAGEAAFILLERLR